MYEDPSRGANRGSQRLSGHTEDELAIQREARAWVIRLSSGEATEEDADELRRWQARSPRHGDAFRDAVRLWRLSGTAVAEAVQGKVAHPTRRRFLTAAAGTAVLAGGVYTAGLLGWIPTWSALLADHATAVGQTSRFMLADGATAELDGASALSLLPGEAGPAVRLSQGAAVFSFAPASDQVQLVPLRVVAGPGETHALPAASFAVTRRPSGVTVSCIAGEVRVICDGETTLETGQRVSYSVDGLSAPMDADVETMASWRNGELVFRGERLSDVVADLNRHRVGRIVVASRSLGERRVSGAVQLDRPDTMFTALSRGLSIRATPSIGGLVFLY